jgi:hypothetical protein
MAHVEGSGTGASLKAWANVGASAPGPFAEVIRPRLAEMFKEDCAGVNGASATGKPVEVRIVASITFVDYNTVALELTSPALGPRTPST